MSSILEVRKRLVECRRELLVVEAQIKKENEKMVDAQSNFAAAQKLQSELITKGSNLQEEMMGLIGQMDEE